MSRRTAATVKGPGDAWARIIWDSEYEEHQVVLYLGVMRQPHYTDYYTPCLDDAKGTAAAMLECLMRGLK